jgi:hypothetical protein
MAFSGLAEGFFDGILGGFFDGILGLISCSQKASLMASWMAFC